MDAIASEGHRGGKADNMFPFGQVWQALESFRRLESKEDDEKKEGDRQGEEARDGKGCEDERCGTSETGSGFTFLHLPGRRTLWPKCGISMFPSNTKDSHWLALF